MKIVNAFAYVFAIFAFLTLGSLMIIVSFNVLTLEDALLKIQDVYESQLKMFQIGATGVIFVLVGLVFTKILMKQAKPGDNVILYGQWGHVNVSLKAIEELVRKIIRKYEPPVRKMKIKLDAEGNQLKLKANLTVSADDELKEIVKRMRQDISSRLTKMLGEEITLDINLHVIKIIDKT